MSSLTAVAKTSSPPPPLTAAAVNNDCHRRHQQQTTTTGFWRLSWSTVAVAMAVVDGSNSGRCQRRQPQDGGGLTNLDGRQHSRQGATDDTTTNHRQERRRGNDVGKGCSDGDGGGKGQGCDGGCIGSGGSNRRLATILSLLLTAVAKTSLPLPPSTAAAVNNDCHCHR